MQLTREQFEQIAPLLPRQRGSVRLENFKVVNAILYVAANGCKWRSLPSCHGPPCGAGDPRRQVPGAGGYG